MLLKKAIYSVLFLSFSLIINSAFAKPNIPTSQRSINAIARVETSLKQQLTIKGLEYGAAIFIRIFKQSNQLEIWIENQNQKFTLFKSYDICTFSGDLGPKLKQGDWQSPEGFYFVKANQPTGFLSTGKTSSSAASLAAAAIFLASSTDSCWLLSNPGICTITCLRAKGIPASSNAFCTRT